MSDSYEEAYPGIYALGRLRKGTERYIDKDGEEMDGMLYGGYGLAEYAEKLKKGKAHKKKGRKKIVKKRISTDNALGVKVLEYY